MIQPELTSDLSTVQSWSSSGELGNKAPFLLSPHPPVMAISDLICRCGKGKVYFIALRLDKKRLLKGRLRRNDWRERKKTGGVETPRPTGQGVFRKRHLLSVNHNRRIRDHKMPVHISLYHHHAPFICEMGIVVVPEPLACPGVEAVKVRWNSCTEPYASSVLNKH